MKQQETRYNEHGEVNFGLYFAQESRRISNIRLFTNHLAHSNTVTTIDCANPRGTVPQTWLPHHMAKLSDGYDSKLTDPEDIKTYEVMYEAGRIRKQEPSRIIPHGFVKELEHCLREETQIHKAYYHPHRSYYQGRMMEVLYLPHRAVDASTDAQIHQCLSHIEKHAQWIYEDIYWTYRPWGPRPFKKGNYFNDPDFRATKTMVYPSRPALASSPILRISPYDNVHLFELSPQIAPHVLLKHRAYRREYNNYLQTSLLDTSEWTNDNDPLFPATDALCRLPAKHVAGEALLSA